MPSHHGFDPPRRRAPISAWVTRTTSATSPGTSRCSTSIATGATGTGAIPWPARAVETWGSWVRSCAERRPEKQRRTRLIVRADALGNQIVGDRGRQCAVRVDLIPGCAIEQAFGLSTSLSNGFLGAKCSEFVSNLNGWGYGNALSKANKRFHFAPRNSLRASLALLDLRALSANDFLGNPRPRQRKNRIAPLRRSRGRSRTRPTKKRS